MGEKVIILKVILCIDRETMKKHNFHLFLNFCIMYNRANYGGERLNTREGDGTGGRGRENTFSCDKKIFLESQRSLLLYI